MKPAMTPQQQQLTDSSTNALNLYRKLVVADGSWIDFFRYEFNTLFFSNLSGLLGFGARSLFYPSMFFSCGKRPAFGRGIILRCPGRISIGDTLLADDYCVIDARGKDSKILIGDCVSIGRFSTITAKEAKISLESGVNIGTYARIATQSSLRIGQSTLIAAYCYIGPGNHAHSDNSKPLITQEMEIGGGVNIGSHCWIGAHSTIMDGVTIGDNSIIGAHSFVKDSIPENSIAVGCPAKVVKKRINV